MLQLKIIASESSIINSTHGRLDQVIVVTHAYSAHLELSLHYVELLADRSLISVSMGLVQAFNRYGIQFALNWLEATPFNAQSTDNMFLVNYYNESRYSVSMGIYPLNTTTGTVKTLQNIKGGSFIETTDLELFSATLFLNANGEPVILNNLLPNSNMNRRSQPVLNRLSNHLKVIATYDRPSEDEYILFRATNDYSEAIYKLPIQFPVTGGFAWYWIVVSTLAFVLVTVSGCLGYRYYTIRRQRKEKESLLTGLEESATEAVSDALAEEKKPNPPKDE